MFNIISPIYKTKFVSSVIGLQKTRVEKSILVKELRLKKWMRKDGITSVEEYITTKNTIAKDRAIIFDKYTNKHYAVNHIPSEIIAELKPKKPIINKIGYK